jgi:hypothetical protein
MAYPVFAIIHEFADASLDAISSVHELLNLHINFHAINQMTKDT